MKKNNFKNAIHLYKNSPVPVKATIWFIMCSFLQKGVATITTPIFTRLLTTGEYGQVVVFNSWQSILSAFVTLNLASGIYMQGLVKYEDERDVYSSSLQGLTLASVCFWALLYVLARDYWNSVFSLTTTQVILLLTTCWITAAFGLWAAEQRVVYKYRNLVVVTLAVAIVSPIASIVLMQFFTDKVTAKLMGAVLVEILGYGGCFFVQVRRGKQLYSHKFWKSAIILALPLIPHYLSQTVLSGSDRIMIEKYVGENQAGIYGLAYSVSLVMTVFQGSLMHALSPWIYIRIREGELKRIADISYPSLIGVAFVNLLLIACAPEIVAIFAPKSYYDAIWIIPPVAMSTYFVFAYDLFAKFQFYYEKTKWIMAASALSAILNIILNYFFIRRYGYYAAGYTTLMCYILYACGHFFFMKKICKKYLNNEKVFDVKILVTITAGFLMIGFLFMFAYRHVWLRYILLGMLIALMFFLRKEIGKYVAILFTKL